MKRLLLMAALLLTCGVPPPPYSEPVDPAAVLRACVMNLSCLSSPLTSKGSTCVGSLELIIARGVGFFLDVQEAIRFVECAKLPTCAAALECASGGHGAQYCAAHPGTSCDGDVLVNCARDGSIALYWTDCAKLGLHCSPTGGGACTDGTACDGSEGGCWGNVAAECRNGLRMPVQCDWIRPDLVCRATSGNFVPSSCLSAGPSCKGSRCEDDVFLWCDEGTAVRYDCAMLEARCDAQLPGCTPLATECDWLNAPDRCAGDSIEICVNGRWRATPCASIGLRTCMPGDPVRCVR
jgi:hypothetical protein